MLSIQVLEQLINCDQELASVFSITEHSLAVSFQYFFMTLCEQLDPLQLYSVGSSIPEGWKCILHPFFYSPKVSSWIEGDPDSEFIAQTRRETRHRTFICVDPPLELAGFRGLVDEVG
jgi:hypothetical protein